MTNKIIADFPFIPASKLSIAQRKPVCGFGINDASYIVSPLINGKRIRCSFHRTWTDMLTRCLCKNYQQKHPSYKGCTLATEWMYFMPFRNWMSKQDHVGKDLDKDILVPGNKHYSPDTCLFVTTAINRLLIDRKLDRGNYPLGVYFNKNINRFTSSVSLHGISVYLGCFNTMREAENAYKKAKSDHIKELSMLEKEPLHSALLNHARLILTN